MKKYIIQGLLITSCFWFSMTNAYCQGWTGSAGTILYAVDNMGSGGNNDAPSVGIGTTTPGTILDIVGPDDGDAVFRISADPDNNANGEGDNVRMVLSQDGGGLDAIIGFDNTRAGTFPQIDNLFRIGLLSTQGYFDILTASHLNGNVGFGGVTNPTADVHINSSLRIENLAAGTGNVLVIDNQGNVGVGACSCNNLSSLAPDNEILDDILFQLESLKIENERLQEQVTNLETRISAKHKMESTYFNVAKANLGQNYPNPANDYTTIEVFLPEEITPDNFQLNFIDSSGRLLLSRNIIQSGKTVLEIDTSSFPNETIFYSLVSDGHIINSMKMLKH